MAHSRRTVTYGGLADLLGFRGAGVMAQFLGQIMFYCQEDSLPPLTVLVVNQDSGLPGGGLTSSPNINADRERVFAYNWFDVVPPTPEELSNVYKKHKAS